MHRGNINSLKLAKMLSKMKIECMYVRALCEQCTRPNYLCMYIPVHKYRLLDSLVVECWLRMWEVPGSIPSQGPRHTKDVIQMVPVVPLFGTQH